MFTVMFGFLGVGNIKKKFEECSFCDTLLDDSQICPTCHSSFNGVDFKEEETDEW